MGRIKKVGIIGAGVMGSGIAAQFANAEIPTILLDIVDNNNSDRSFITKNAINKMIEQKPQPLLHKKLSRFIKAGNLTDNLDYLSDCDLVIEAIIEKSDIKQSLFKSIFPYLKKDTLIASNTSTLSLKTLKQNLELDLQNKIIITHFFNPPRYMELLELISDNNTNQDILNNIIEFLDKNLGKAIIKCHDKPGFIANRLGCFLLELTVRNAIKLNLDPYKIDQIFIKYLGFPSTGIFGLYDLIGHDVMKLISNSLINSLDKNDKYNEIYQKVETLIKMQELNLLGRKKGAGFYKLIKENGKKFKQAINLSNLTYNNIAKPSLPNFDNFIEEDKQYSDFITNILITFFDYLENIHIDIADSKKDIDEAMKLGYSLKYGPFELINNLSNYTNHFSKKIKEKYSQHILDFYKNKEQSNNTANKVIIYNNDAELTEYNDKYLTFKLKTKLNILTNEIFTLLKESVDYAEQKNKNIIIYQQNNPHFSAGANLKYFYRQAESNNFSNIEKFIEAGQQTMLKLKYAKINIISCASGLALGGGCELLLHSHHIIANQNMNAGLVEMSVGLIPGWGGVKEMFLRSEGKEDLLISNLLNILTQYKANSCYYFKEKFANNCSFNMNKNYLLEQALNYDKVKNETIKSINLPDVNLAKQLDIGKFSNFQKEILEFFQNIIDNNKNISEEKLLEYEKNKFMQLIKRTETINILKNFV